MRYAVVASRGVWRSLVARFVRDEEVVGSNPATPTSEQGPDQGNLVGAFLFQEAAADHPPMRLRPASQNRPEKLARGPYAQMLTNGTVTHGGGHPGPPPQP